MGITSKLNFIFLFMSNNRKFKSISQTKSVGNNVIKVTVTKEKKITKKISKNYQQYLQDYKPEQHIKVPFVEVYLNMLNLKDPFLIWEDKIIIAKKDLTAYHVVFSASLVQLNEYISSKLYAKVLNNEDYRQELIHLMVFLEFAELYFKTFRMYEGYLAMRLLISVITDVFKEVPEEDKDEISEELMDITAKYHLEELREEVDTKLKNCYGLMM